MISHSIAKGISGNRPYSPPYKPQGLSIQHSCSCCHLIRRYSTRVTEILSLNKPQLSHGCRTRFTFLVHPNFAIPIGGSVFSIPWIKATVCYTETLIPIKLNYLNTNTVIFTELRNLFVVRFENRAITTKTQNELFLGTFQYKTTSRRFARTKIITSDSLNIFLNYKLVQSRSNWFMFLFGIVGRNILKDSRIYVLYLYAVNITSVKDCFTKKEWKFPSSLIKLWIDVSRNYTTFRCSPHFYQQACSV
jgi:hypothetical protein